MVQLLTWNDEIQIKWLFEVQRWSHIISPLFLSLSPHWSLIFICPSLYVYWPTTIIYCLIIIRSMYR